MLQLSQPWVVTVMMAALAATAGAVSPD